MDGISPVSRKELISLRTAERKAKIERLIGGYVRAIRSHVLDVAKYGTKRYVHFWIVDELSATVELRHVTGLFYPWHSKYVRPVSDLRKRRPIPYEYLNEIMEDLGQIFPDSHIERIQDFLFISW
jgi:hypothetical protein